MNVNLIESGGTVYTAAPRQSGAMKETTEKSNVKSNICRARSCSVSEWLDAKCPSRKASKLACVMGTPFGVPVVPDVKSKYAKLSWRISAVRSSPGRSQELLVY